MTSLKGAGCVGSAWGSLLSFHHAGLLIVEIRRSCSLTMMSEMAMLRQLSC